MYNYLYLANWKEELQKYISPDNLPEYYGGTRREPDAICSNYVCVYTYIRIIKLLICMFQYIVFYLYKDACMHIHTRIHMHIHTHTHACTHIYTCTYTHIHMHVHTYTCTCTCTCTCTHTYTRTHNLPL